MALSSVCSSGSFRSNTGFASERLFERVQPFHLSRQCSRLVCPKRPKHCPQPPSGIMTCNRLIDVPISPSLQPLGVIQDVLDLFNGLVRSIRQIDGRLGPIQQSLGAQAGRRLAENSTTCGPAVNPTCKKGRAVLVASHVAGFETEYGSRLGISGHQELEPVLTGNSLLPFCTEVEVDPFFVELVEMPMQRDVQIRVSTPTYNKIYWPVAGSRMKTNCIEMGRQKNSATVHHPFVILCQVPAKTRHEIETGQQISGDMVGLQGVADMQNSMRKSVPDVIKCPSPMNIARRGGPVHQQTRSVTAQVAFGNTSDVCATTAGLSAGFILV